MTAHRPPPLPLVRKRQSLRLTRMLILGIAQALVVLLIAWLLDGITIDGFLTALIVVGVLALLNALFWPLLVRLTLPIIVLTAGLFTLVLNVAFVGATAWLVDGFDVSSFWSALALALALAAANVGVGGLLSVDDDHVWRQMVAKRIVARDKGGTPVETSEPGFLYIQIDGLGHDVLLDAMAGGHAPTLATLVEAGTHRVLGWECDLSSQTGAMQAGILLGDNHNMPAFRWYEKDTGRVMVSNRPKDASELEQRQSTSTGLLVGGASRANVFSGDATDSMFTFSTVLDGPPGRVGLLHAMSTPYALLRIVVLAIVDIGRELRAARRAKRDKVEPRMHRGGVYPFLRAATVVVLPEVTYGALIGDIERGVPSSYADLVGYDEVAHHSGIVAPEALDTLQRIDDQLRRLLLTLEDAPRPYYVVVLSDHGQTQGWSFAQRHDETLEEVVRALAREAKVAAPLLAEEGWNNVNGFLTDAAGDESTLGRTVARATKKNTVDGEVSLGPETETEISLDDEIVVLASGNLGLLSFPTISGRASLQEIDALYPGLVDGLRHHEGIGFLLVRDEQLGDVALGGSGARYLVDDRVEGEDPLAPYGGNAGHHLRRTSTFSNCPDLLMCSRYDPVTDEGAAFEDQVGFHGGLGGRQSKPFVLAPADLPIPDAPLVGARSIHDMLKGWQRDVQGAG